jgi:hypothetical protein
MPILNLDGEEYVICAPVAQLIVAMTDQILLLQSELDRMHGAVTVLNALEAQQQLRDAEPANRRPV